jgi:hypothetical protein
MSCGCTDYTGKVKNAYYTYQEAYDNKIWTEKHLNVSLRIYQCHKGYWHLTLKN